MNSECREFLRKHIQVYLEKNPASSQKDVREWLNSGDQKFNLKDVKKSSMFITDQMEKFREKGKCDKHSGGNGRPATPGRTVGRMKQLMLNKKRRSTRNVAAKLKLSSC